MADKIYINTDIYRQITNRLTDLSRELSDCAASLSRVNTEQEAGGTLPIHLGSRLSSIGESLPSGRISSCIRGLRQTIRELRDHTGDMADNIRKAMNLFEVVESELAMQELGGSRPAVFTDGQGADGCSPNPTPNRGSGILETITDGDVALCIGEDFAQLVIGGIPIAMCVGGLLNPSAFSMLAPLIGDPSALREAIQSSPVHSLDQLVPDWMSIGSSGEWDLDSDGDGVSPLADRLSVFTVSAKKGVSESLFSFGDSRSNGDVTASWDIGLGNGSAEAGASAGIYATKVGPDGKTTYELAPGAEVHAGVSVSVFEATASGMYEIVDGVDLTSTVTATAGELSAEGEIKIGIVDGDLNLYAGGELEAIAGEIEGELGLNVMGVDASVNASLNYGIGGHAEVGMDDGVLKVDIGLSIGVGGSIGFEVDVAGMVNNAADAVCGFVESAWNFFM